jgi:hypothetical protein
MVYSAVEALVIRAALADQLQRYELRLWRYESRYKNAKVEHYDPYYIWLQEKPDKCFLGEGDMLAAKLTLSMNTSLSIPYITKALTWARLILHLPNIFGDFKKFPIGYLKKRTYSLVNWEKVGRAALEFASTPMQIRFSEDLLAVDIQYRTYVSEWDHHLRRAGDTEDLLTPVAGRIIYEIAKKRKFVVFGNCLWHPTEYPGTGTPSSRGDMLNTMNVTRWW